MISIQSFGSIGIVWKIGCNAGTYIASNINSKEEITAQTKYILPNGFLEKIDFSLRQSNTWISCVNTRVANATVCAYAKFSGFLW